MNSKLYPMPDENTIAETVILADGEYPADGIPASILRNARRVICCDGAADTFIGNGGLPTAIVGDGDSLSKETRQKYASIISFDSDQETNDLTKAFRFCHSHGYGGITILGATGKREDHTIANISLIADYSLESHVQMITQTGVFDAIHESACFESSTGAQVSIFAISNTTKVDVENLKYTPPAKGLYSWWRGSLNESEGDWFAIHTQQPTIIFRAFDIKR